MCQRRFGYQNIDAIKDLAEAEESCLARRITIKDCETKFHIKVCERRIT